MQNVSVRKKVDVKRKRKRTVTRGSAEAFGVFKFKAAPSVIDNLKRRVSKRQSRHPVIKRRVSGKSRANNCCSLNHKEYQTSIQASARHLQTNAKLMAELFESEDEEVSEVESFILEHGDLEEEPVLDTSKLLLSAEGADSPDLQTVDSETRAVLEAAGITFGEAHEVDPESRARLEALLDAAGLGKHIIDPEVLRRLTSSVSCALDEAAAALTRMRSEQQNCPTTSSSSSSLCNNSKQHQSSQQHAALDAVAAAVVDGSSLIDACNDGDLEAVRRLLDEGRNVNEVTEEGESLLSLACSSGYYELAQLLLATRANVEDRGLKDTTPLMEAASAGHVDIVKLLLTHGADVNAQTSQGNTPLMYACASGREDVVKILLDSGANVEDHNENGHTPLMEAASAGHVNVARMLVAHGASINTHSNEFKESALTLACYKGHLEMVQFLLEAGADQEHKTEEMHTALMEASMDGHVEVARLLLDSGAQVNMPADSFESPLTLAACGGHVELAMLLLERGANIEEVNDEGYTPLMEAAREGHEEMVALLLNQAADINAQTEETQETALTLACCGGFLEVADFLIKAGADIEAGANTPLMEAAQEGHLDLVRHLINCDANVNATTNSGDTALMYACENGHTDVAELLLKAGADLEHEAEGGRTPLMKAARAGHLCTVQFLVGKGANVNKMTTNNDHTPLSLACAGGHIMVVEFLLANGADPTHRLKDNSTMLIEAAKGGHTNVVQLLIDYPNSSVKSPPPLDISQLTTSTTVPSDICDNSAPRVPPHGVQPNVDISEHLVSSSNQRKSSASSSGSSKHGIQKGSSRSKCNKSSDLVEPYIPLAKGRSNSNKHLERSLSDGSASQLLSSVSTTGSASEVSSSSSTTAGVGIDALKETERLEQCINNMMKRTEMLNPSREEQILQKQQILEELQRVERELQEKAQAQLLLTHQAQQQQQLIQSLCFQAGLSSTAISSTQTTSEPITTSAASEQEQLNLSSPSPAMLLLDMSTWKQPLKTGDCVNFQMQSSTVPSSDLSASATSLAQQPTTEQISEVSSASATPVSADVTVSTVASQTILSNISPNTASGSGNRTRSKQTTKVKNTTVKQQTQLQPSSSQSIADNVEKMNLRNVMNNEQQQASLQSSTDLNQTIQSQQQYILSELAQSFSNLRQAKPEAFFQQSASHVKFDTPLPFLLPPLFELNSFSQSVGLQPQHQQTQSTQTLISSLPDVFDVKKPIGLQSQVTQQLSPQHQQTQSTQTSDIQNLENYSTSSNKQLAAKSSKSVKIGTKGNQNQTSIASNQQQNSPITSAALVPSLTSQQLQVLKNQFAAAAAAASQQQPLNVDTNLNMNNLSQTIQLNSSTGLVIAGATTANTAYGTLVPTSGVFALGAPAFPVTLSLSPTPSAASVTTSNNGAIYQQPLSLETTEVNASFLLKSHQRSLPDGAVSDFALGTSASHTVADNCFDGINYSNSSALFTNTVTSVPVGIESISFPQIPVSSATNNQTKMMTSNNLGTSSCSTNVGGSISTSVEQAIQNSLKIPQTSTVSVATVSTTVPAKPSSVPSPPPWYPPIDLDSQTDSNHDTALTLACAGGHEELVQLLLNRGANMEHRDKKGFTPLMLAATAGHANVCEILLSNNSDIEAQSERTKDTALSLACSSGRYEVVELLLSRGANKEHRNVSDYTPLSLAASGGYVNIIKLLLSHGAEINSRTGSKLGISPLMLAAMNGHAATVKLLLDMGSDINAQIETNRNTALTLACFQGRCEVVSLLLDRKANVEHRAKTGLTPLMEAASGGYVEVGRILLDKGADVNAPPVPSSRDTALTIAADKGHYRFVELLLQRGAQVDVKNKKGSSPLWLACNGGHLDVVQLLVNSGADIDSQDNRKVSCLMASFRKGHVKVVKWMVKHVTQFPSDQEMTRYLALISDKELMKKCNQCVDIIRQAKEKQAAEANKNATILLEEIDMERSREESRKLAAARRRERKRQKKKEKQEQLKAAKIAQESKEKKGKNNESKQTQLASKCERKEDESDFETDDDVDDSNDEEELISSIRQSPEKEQKRCESNKIQQTAKKKEVEKNRKNQQPTHLIDSIQQSQLPSSNTGKKREEKQKSPSSSKSTSKMDVEITTFNPSEDEVSSKLTDGLLPSTTQCSTAAYSGNNIKTHRTKNVSENVGNTITKRDTDCFIDLSVDVSKEIDKPLIHLKSPNTIIVKNSATVCNSGNASVSGGASKKVQKREEGWKEVVRRSKKVSVPANAISRVIGRAGCNINTVREISGAHIEVEKQKMQGDRQIIIKGSADATRHAQQLINGLVNEPEKELSQIIQQLGLNRPSSCNGEESFQRGGPLKSSSSTVISNSVNRVLNPVTSGVVKSASVTSVLSSSGYVSCSVTTTSSTRTTAAIPVRPTVSPANVAPPFANNNPVVNHAWGSSKTTLPPRLLASANSQSSHLCTSPKMEIQSSNAKTLVYNDSTNTAVTSSKAKTTSKSSQSNAVPKVKLMTNSDSKPNSLPFPGTVRPQSQPFSSSSRVSNVANKVQHQTKPFGNSCVHSNVGGSTATTVTTTTTSANTPPEYSPFNNLFSKVAQQSVWGQTKESHKPNFASVAASGISSVAASQQVTSITSSLTIPLPTTSEPEVTVDASKAPGYRGNLHVSPSNASLSSTPSSSTGSNFGPIGSGPRSAPCTPPLLAMSSHNTNRQSTPPSSNIASTPPPVNRTAVQEGYQQELNNSQNVSYSAHSVVSSTFQQSSSTNFASCISSQQMKSNAFNLAPGATVARTFTNTTYSQHAPVSSVGQIHPPLNGNECLNVNSMQPNAMNITGMSGSVQSSLNPNAPDFSSRSSTSFSNSQSTQQSNGSTIRGSQHHSQPRSMAFQDVIPNPQLQMQMRAAILAAGASLQMQTLQAQAAQAQAIQNRFQFGQSNFTPAAHHHQQAAAAAAAAASLGTPDFTPPSAETLRLLHTAISAFPAANAALHASTPQNMQQFGLMQTAINLRQQQTQARIPSGASINVQPQMAKECEASSTENHEERKLPRPIGTERAQKKNPGYATSNNQFGSTSVDVMQSGIWPFSEVNVEGGDWLQTPIPAESMTNVLPNSFHARNYRSIDDQQTDSAVEHPFLTNNATSAYANVSATPVVNGLPPQMVAQPNILYHNTNVAPSVANPNSTLQEAADYWTGKMPNVPGLGNGVSTQNTDHKLSWQTWNQHQA